MTDPRREFRVGCYIFSLDRITRHVEELAPEEWAYDLQNHSPISRGLGERSDDSGIPFLTIIPYPYPPTIRPPREPARYISTDISTQFNGGAPPLMRSLRTLHQPLQPQALRSESSRPLGLHIPPPAIQLPFSYQATLHPPISPHAPTILTHFQPADP